MENQTPQQPDLLQVAKKEVMVRQREKDDAWFKYKMAESALGAAAEVVTAMESEIQRAERKLTEQKGK